jgi:methionine biosynthesis protein MetW
MKSLVTPLVSEGLLRPDLQRIFECIAPHSRVLDLGCGDGELMEALLTHKHCQVLGVEQDSAAVQRCLAKGLNVYHGQLEEALADYTPTEEAAPKPFDVVVLNQTLQRTANPVAVVQGMLRVGRQAVVGFPNFGYWRIRLQLLVRGRMPSSPSLPFSWYDTPNIHLFTLEDFRVLCRGLGVRAAQCHVALWGGWRLWPYQWGLWPSAPNLLATEAIYVLQPQE